MFFPFNSHDTYLLSLEAFSLVRGSTLPSTLGPFLPFCKSDFCLNLLFLSVLNFADKEDQKTIPVLIKKDDTPELSETITVKLLAVQLVSGSPKNYSVVDGLPLSTPPRISLDKNRVMIAIEENDDARGIVRFTESSKLVREESRVVVLRLVREGKLG